MITLDEKLPPQNPPPYEIQPPERAATTYPPPQPTPQLRTPSGNIPASSPRSPYPPQPPPNAYTPSPRALPPQAMADAQLGSMYQQQLYARCARGDHDVVTKHGACGIITAILLFPLGLICLFVDTERKCARCGERVP